MATAPHVREAATKKGSRTAGKPLYRARTTARRQGPSSIEAENPTTDTSQQQGTWTAGDLPTRPGDCEREVGDEEIHLPLGLALGHLTTTANVIGRS